MKRLRGILIYVTIAVALSAGLYYLPNYFILERLTAENSAALLSLLGVSAESWVREGRAFVNEFEIERMCTGIQVTAVFLGLLIPLPHVAWRRKLVAIVSVGIFVYVANILRIALEIILLYEGILPWSLAHYPTGLILGVFSVALLVIVLDLFIPEIGDYAIGAMESLFQKRNARASLG